VNINDPPVTGFKKAILFNNPKLRNGGNKRLIIVASILDSEDNLQENKQNIHGYSSTFLALNTWE
jgi:hypothetical protein